MIGLRRRLRETAEKKGKLIRKKRVKQTLALVTWKMPKVEQIP